MSPYKYKILRTEKVQKYIILFKLEKYYWLLFQEYLQNRYQINNPQKLLKKVYKYT